MKSEYQELIDNLPENMQIPEFEFDSKYSTFTNLNSGDVISLKCYDQNGNVLNTKKVLNGIDYYHTMRIMSALYPESEAAIDFLKSHPSCDM